MNDLTFFLRLFKPHSLWLAGGIVLALLTAFAAIALLTLSGWFISASAIAGLGGDVLLFNFMLPAAQIRALAITRTLGRYGERLVTHEATFRVLTEIRVWFFAQLIPLALGRLSESRSGDLLTRMTADIDALDALYLRLLAPAVVAAIGVTGVTVFLYQYDPLISLSTGILLLIASVAIPMLFNKLGKDGAENTVTLAASLRLRQLEMLQGMTDLLANQAYSRFSEAFAKNSARLIDTEADNNRLTAISSSLTLLLSQLGLLLALILVALGYKNGVLSGADIAIVIFCVIAAFELVQPLPQALQMLGKTQAAAHRVRQLATLTPTISIAHFPNALPNCYDLCLQDVSFGYSERLVLKNLNLILPHGAKIAIIGASGSGKTTLLQLLTRHHDPKHGEILLGDVAINQLNHDELLSCFGVLSQRSQLFAATIKDNLLLAKRHATQNELNAAINFAGLTQFIGRLPDGIHTWVGESGAKVSGGEARRIALAQLYLKNAPILLLDEPTEGLDSDTERDVMSALANFAQHKTLIMVTHRPVGLELVDVVYSMEHGVLGKVNAESQNNSALSPTSL
ncbi:MAG: thiol reductant ABC exporter subunit CydC [Methylococcaceae bacterium]|nr:thiol reductant ABC exporter subunit CydC [Methylococcaceae bacterium]